MEDFRKLNQMGMIDNESLAETKQSIEDYFKGDIDAIDKRINKLDGMPTQERKAKHTPKHAKQPLAFKPLKKMENYK